MRRPMGEAGSSDAEAFDTADAGGQQRPARRQKQKVGWQGVMSAGPVACLATYSLTFRM
jgi:hypothetical protein